MLMSSIFQDDIMLIILWHGGTQNTPVASGRVNVTAILTLKFFFINHVIHGSSFTFQYEYVLLFVLWKDDCGKLPMVSHQVNDSVIIPKHD